MTLIVSLANSEHIIQVSDRRLSRQGKIVEDNSNKVGLLRTGNGRFAYGFTGLAAYNGFHTETWLTQNLCESGAPDFDTKSTLDRLLERLNQEFSTNRVLKPLDAAHKRLSICISGYLDDRDPPLAGIAVISNFEDLEKKVVHEKASEKFRFFSQLEQRPNSPNMRIFHSIGANFTEQYIPEWHRVIDMMADHKPASAVIGLLVEIFRAISGDSIYRNTVGSNLYAIVIPRDSKKGFNFNYYPDKAKPETFYPSLVFAIDKRRHFALKDIKFDTNEGFLSGPKLKANELCWCPSGKKYRDCHGMGNRPVNVPPVNISLKDGFIVIDLEPGNT